MKKNTGFTLVEIVVVVALIAILLVFIVTNLNKNRALARDNVRIAHIDTIRLVLDEYRSYCGVYPNTLSLTANNGRTGVCSKSLGEFIGEIPENPAYSPNNDIYYQNYEAGPTVDRSQYMYYGLSHVLNGPCFDYVIGVQMEYGSSNDYLDGEHSKDFAKINQSSLSDNATHQYSFRCGGSDSDGIPGAATAENGIYGFRSNNAG